MKLKKTVSALLAGAMLLGTSAVAKDNIYAYNKFISTVIGLSLIHIFIAVSYQFYGNDCSVIFYIIKIANTLNINKRFKFMNISVSERHNVICIRSAGDMSHTTCKISIITACLLYTSENKTVKEVSFD